MARVDDSGEPTGNEDILIRLPLTDGGEVTIVAQLDGVRWNAGEKTGAGFPGDTYTVDDRRAEGTFTFVNEAGDEVQGSLEVFCAEG